MGGLSFRNFTPGRLLDKPKRARRQASRGIFGGHVVQQHQHFCAGGNCLAHRSVGCRINRLACKLSCRDRTAVQQQVHRSTIVFGNMPFSHHKNPRQNLVADTIVDDRRSLALSQIHPSALMLVNHTTTNRRRYFAQSKHLHDTRAMRNSIFTRRALRLGQTCLA